MGETTIASLVAAAAAGDEGAWHDIIDRYAPLLSGVIAGYRLSTAAQQDVAQIVWLRLVENLDRLRSARALPKWLVTTARREALHQLRVQAQATMLDPTILSWTEVHRPGASTDQPDPEPDGPLLAAELREALLAAFAELPDHQRRLLEMLLVDPPPSYSEISNRLGIPIGNIGPTRKRALGRLRRSHFLRGLADWDPEPAGGGG